MLFHLLKGFHQIQENHARYPYSHSGAVSLSSHIFRPGRLLPDGSIARSPPGGPEIRSIIAGLPLSSYRSAETSLNPSQHIN
eukprot:5878533-Pyramimonas_sp.AAC.1